MILCHKTNNCLILMMSSAFNIYNWTSSEALRTFFATSHNIVEYLKILSYLHLQWIKTLTAKACEPLQTCVDVSISYKCVNIASRVSNASAARISKFVLGYVQMRWAFECLYMWGLNLQHLHHRFCFNC